MRMTPDDADNLMSDVMGKIDTETLKDALHFLSHLESVTQGAKYAVANYQYLTPEQLKDYLVSVVEILDEMLTSSAMAGEVELITREDGM